MKILSIEVKYLASFSEELSQITDTLRCLVLAYGRQRAIRENSFYKIHFTLAKTYVDMLPTIRLIKIYNST